MSAAAIIVTGLPASGKTTVARQLGERLQWPVIDKDSLLEQLFEEHPVKTPADRKRLSRVADDHFIEQASKSDVAVLVSHWKPNRGPQDTGTPTDWIPDAFSELVEVHCHCPPHVAAKRFVERSRHPSHLDSLRTAQDVQWQMLALAGGYPLDAGIAITVNTEASYNFGQLIEQIEATRNLSDKP